MKPIHVLLLLGCIPAQAAWHSVRQAAIPAGANYTGPGDIVPGAVLWYGLRGYNAAYSTGSNNAINIRRSSDNTTVDIKILSGGSLDTATAATFCASTSCFVDEWYDQSGNSNHLIQTTAASQPQLIFSCVGSLPCVKFSGGQEFVLASITVTQPFTYSFVTERYTNFTTYAVLQFSNTSPGNQIYWGAPGGGTPNAIGEYAGSEVDATIADGALHAVQGVMNGGSSVMNGDGTETTGNAGSFGLSSSFVIGSTGGANFASMYLDEFGIFPTAFTSGGRASMCHNQFSYWGSSVAC